MPALILSLLLFTVSYAEQPDTPPPTPKFVCQNLLVGAKTGRPYAGGPFKVLRWLIQRRYDVQINGLDEILARGDKGIFFLPNHTGPIDPVLMVSSIGKETAVRPVMTEGMTHGFFGSIFKRLLGLVNGFILPDPAQGQTSIALARAVIGEAVKAARTGDNILLHPSGTLQLSAKEMIGQKSGVEMILKANPDARLVLVRQRGLWGGSFTHGAPESPKDQPLKTGQVISRGMGNALKMLFANAFYFVPKRSITLDFVEPTDFPRHGKREEMNAYLENFYNQPPEQRTFVRRYFWQKKIPKVAVSPDPIDYTKSVQPESAAAADVQDETTLRLIKMLNASYGVANLRADTSLADAGVDSLNRVVFFEDVASKFHIEIPDDLAADTIGGLARFVDEASTPEASNAAAESLKPSEGWLSDLAHKNVIGLPKGDTVAEMIVRRGLNEPNLTIAEDQTRGPLTYKKLIVTAQAMSREFEKLPGERVGILMPAAGSNPILYLAAHLAGKTPVFVNFTGRTDQVEEILEKIGVQKIITARAVVNVIVRGHDVSPFLDKLVYLENHRLQIAAHLPMAKAEFRFNPQSILARSARTKETVVLVTSGSSGKPKAVPLSHENILANVKDMYQTLKIRGEDRLLIFAPPFHSFGHMVQVLSLVLGVPAVYHPRVDQVRTLGNLIHAYKATITAGPPTLITPIAAYNDPSRLDSVRMIFMGAEALKPDQIEKNNAGFRNAELLEGYGATELSPVVAVNPPGAAKLGTVGRVVPALKYKIVDSEKFSDVKPGAQGLLMVRGASVFAGYLGRDPEAESPFRTLNDGESYYNTGDIVSEDTDGYITIHDRESRFSKHMGEMVSHTAVENLISPLVEAKRPKDNTNPILAVESLDNEDLTLFTVVDLNLADVKKYMLERNVKGSSLIRAVRKVDEIPMLGTGKTNYRVLKDQLKRS